MRIRAAVFAIESPSFQLIPPVMSNSVLKSLLPALSSIALLLISCGGTVNADTGVGDIGEEVAQQGPHVRPGKQYIPGLGLFLPVRPDGGFEVKPNEAFYRLDDGMVLSVGWLAEPDELYQRFVEGIPVGEKVVLTNGQKEEWPKNRMAFATFFGDPRSGVTDEYRLNVWESGHGKGSLMVVAYFTQANEDILALAKERVLEVLDGAEHVSIAEEERITTSLQQAEERAFQQRVTTIASRARSAREARVRQALMGKALVKVKGSSSVSSTGSAYSTSVERIQLCPDGIGLWTYGSDMNVQSENTNNQGDRSVTGLYHGNSENRVAGKWDVVLRNGELHLLIYAPEGGKDYVYEEGADVGACMVGGMMFRVSGPGDSYGPECR